MFQIRDWLFIGKYADTTDLDWLQSHHIGAMLLLAERVEHPDIISYYLPVNDGEKLPRFAMESGLRFICDSRDAGLTMLVACGAGISRSATFCIAALMEIEGLTLAAAYQAVLDANPRALPHPALLGSLLEHFRLEVDVVGVWANFVRLGGS
jgi:protein-tyrosine phosphatase